MFGYMTFNAKYYILSQIFYKKIGWLSQMQFDFVPLKREFQGNITQSHLLKDFWRNFNRSCDGILINILK